MQQYHNFMHQFYNNVVVLLSSQTVRSFAMAVFSVNAAHRIHDRLARRLVRFPQQFFEATPSGRILNRFSKDINDVDSQLSERWQFLLMCSLRVLSILVMLCVASWVFIPVLVVILGLYVQTEHLYNIQCSEIFTLRNEKLHTEA